MQSDYSFTYLSPPPIVFVREARTYARAGASLATHCHDSITHITPVPSTAPTRSYIRRRGGSSTGFFVASGHQTSSCLIVCSLCVHRGSSCSVACSVIHRGHSQALSHAWSLLQHRSCRTDQAVASANTTVIRFFARQYHQLPMYSLQHIHVHALRRSIVQSQQLQVPCRAMPLMRMHGSISIGPWPLQLQLARGRIQRSRNLRALISWISALAEHSPCQIAHLLVFHIFIAHCFSEISSVFHHSGRKQRTRSICTWRHLGACPRSCGLRHLQ